jgi:hypothetical protein
MSVDIAVAVIAGLFGLLLGILTARQGRQLELAASRLERFDALLKAARAFERMLKTYPTTVPLSDEEDGLRRRVRDPSLRAAYLALLDAAEHAELVASLEVTTNIKGLKVSAIVLFQALDNWARELPKDIDSSGPRPYPDELSTALGSLDAGIRAFIGAVSDDLAPWTSIRIMWRVIRRRLRLP